MHKASNQQDFPLNQLRCGAQGTIVQINADAAEIQRIGMLGLRKGTQIAIVHGPGRRGAVVQSGGARIALGPELTDKIMIEPLNVQAVAANNLVAGRSL